jgi:hypothetical protein
LHSRESHIVVNRCHRSDQKGSGKHSEAYRHAVREAQKQTCPDAVRETMMSVAYLMCLSQNSSSITKSAYHLLVLSSLLHTPCRSWRWRASAGSFAHPALALHRQLQQKNRKQTLEQSQSAVIKIVSSVCPGCGCSGLATVVCALHDLVHISRNNRIETLGEAACKSRPLTTRDIAYMLRLQLLCMCSFATLPTCIRQGAGLRGSVLRALALPLFFSSFLLLSA